MDADNTLSPEEAKIVRRGEAQLRRGQSKPWALVRARISGQRPVSDTRPADDRLA